MPDIQLQSVAAEIAHGDQLTLITLSRQFSVNPSTCLRWVLRGLPDGHGGRIRLEAVRRGKPWLTSRAALARFLAALPQSTATPNVPEARTPSKREHDSARAAKILKAKYGI
jgi:hypothetical protein